jgi:hypothetical protein
MTSNEKSERKLMRKEEREREERAKIKNKPKE